MVTTSSTVRAFHSKGTLVEYWTIDVSGEYWAIHHGPRGTIGEWQVQEFLDEETAAESAAELIAAKKRSGYVEDPAFDPNEPLYLDDPEFGPHVLTSHPVFNAAFTDELYLDVVDEEAPFGSDTGSDTLTALEEAYTGKNRPVLSGFAQELITGSWEMDYHDPLTPEPTTTEQYWAAGGASTTDQAVLAVCLGAIKATGTVTPELKALALAALRRRIGVGGPDGEPDEIGAQILADLDAFPA